MSKFGTYAWFKELPPEDYQKLLDHLGEQTRNIFSGVQRLDYRFEDDNVRDNYYQVFHSYKQIDYTNRKISFLMWRTLFKNVVPNLNKISLYGHPKAGDLRSTLFVSKSKRAGASVRTIKHRLVKEDTASSSFSVLANLELPSMAKALTAQTETPFPSVNNVIENVLMLTNRGLEMASSVEDKYFFEQVQTAYIPTIVKASQTVKSSSSEVRIEAIDNFLKQLHLIEEKAATLLLGFEKRAIMEVNNQTALMLETLALPEKGMTI